MDLIRTAQEPNTGCPARLIVLHRGRGLAQQGFVDATDIHFLQIERHEAGTSQPSAIALKKIARCFGLATCRLPLKHVAPQWVGPHSKSARTRRQAAKRVSVS